MRLRRVTSLSVNGSNKADMKNSKSE